MIQITTDEINQIKFLVDNFRNIPVKYWESTETNKDRKVVWILNRQKPSVEPYYSFDEERLGITGEGKIIYGFDSGCSCPAPWYDCGDEVYTEKTWKELEVNFKELENFEGFEMDDKNRLSEIVNTVRSLS